MKLKEHQKKTPKTFHLMNFVEDAVIVTCRLSEFIPLGKKKLKETN